MMMLNQWLERGSTSSPGTINRPMPRFVRHPGLGGVSRAERQAFPWLKTRRWLELGGRVHIETTGSSSTASNGQQLKRDEI
jgi:hypothetical protein